MRGGEGAALLAPGVTAGLKGMLQDGARCVRSCAGSGVPHSRTPVPLNINEIGFSAKPTILTHVSLLFLLSFFPLCLLYT